MKQIDLLLHQEKITQWVSECLSKREMAKRLGCSAKTVDKCLLTLGIDYRGKQGWLKGLTYNSEKYMPFEVYIQSGVVQTNKLRKKLLREGLKSHMCECCKLTQWNGNQIPLEVHHINGDKTNNELSNLQLLCPNCHALTPTYRGKNIKKK